MILTIKVEVGLLVGKLWYFLKCFNLFFLKTDMMPNESKYSVRGLVQLIFEGMY